MTAPLCPLCHGWGHVSHADDRGRDVRTMPCPRGCLEPEHVDRETRDATRLAARMAAEDWIADVQRRRREEEARRPWTIEDDAQLRSLWRAGEPLDAISEVLVRSPQRIVGRVRKLRMMDQAGGRC